MAMMLTELVVDPFDGFKDVDRAESAGREAGHRAVDEVTRELASQAQEPEADADQG
jgi:hypothetical protein